MLKEVLDVPAVAKLAADPGSFRNYWRGGTVKVRQLDGRSGSGRARATPACCATRSRPALTARPSATSR